MSKLQEVAAAAGVSKSTVSRVINNSGIVSPAAKQKVLEALQQLQINVQEIKRMSEGTATIGIVIPLGASIGHTSFGIDIMVGAEEKAFEKDYMILVGNSGGNGTRESSLVGRMVNRGVEGLIMLSFNRDEPEEHLDFLKTSGIPIVLVDQRLESLPANSVSGDNFGAAVSLMEHLFSIGHRRITLVTPDPHPTHKERIRGYRYAMQRMAEGATLEQEIVWEEDEMGRTGLLRQLSSVDRPTALLVAAPKLLTAVMETIEQCGLSVPEDVSIVTFDEAYVTLPGEYDQFFTSVNQSGKLMGSMAVELLFQQMKSFEQEPQDVILRGKLTVRKSTAPAQTGVPR